MTTAPEPSPRASWLGRVRAGAWSRAGAIAQVIAAGPTRRATSYAARVALLAGGSVVIAVAVSVTLWTGLGPGPLDVFIGAVRARSGLPLGVTVWLTVGSMVAVAHLLGRRAGPGTVLSPFVIGAVMEIAVRGLSAYEPPSAVPAAIGVHLGAVVVLGFGAGALIVSGLGAGSGELLAAAASDRSGRDEPHVRIAIESGLLVLGVALGGPVGVGTVLVALTIGPAVAFGYRCVSSLVAGRAGVPPGRPNGDRTRPNRGRLLRWQAMNRTSAAPTTVTIPTGTTSGPPCEPSTCFHRSSGRRRRPAESTTRL